MSCSPVSSSVGIFDGPPPGDDQTHPGYAAAPEAGKIFLEGGGYKVPEDDPRADRAYRNENHRPQSATRRRPPTEVELFDEYLDLLKARTA